MSEADTDQTEVTEPIRTTVAMGGDSAKFSESCLASSAAVADAAKCKCLHSAVSSAGVGMCTVKRLTDIKRLTV